MSSGAAAAGGGSAGRRRGERRPRRVSACGAKVRRTQSVPGSPQVSRGALVQTPPPVRLRKEQKVLTL